MPPKYATTAPSHVKAQEPAADRVERVRVKLREARDLTKEIEARDAALKESKLELYTLLHRGLPELFREAAIDSLGLPPEGNMPGYDCVVRPYYKANISAEWPEEKRNNAFNYLIKKKAEDLIKSVITIALGRNTDKTRKAIVTALRKLKLQEGRDYTIDKAVPWNSLTSWFKDQVENAGYVPDLEILGAEAGEVIKLTERKEEK